MNGMPALLYRTSQQHATQQRRNKQSDDENWGRHVLALFHEDAEQDAAYQHSANHTEDVVLRGVPVPWWG
jgi:hypothetical protein